MVCSMVLNEQIHPEGILGCREGFGLVDGLIVLVKSFDRHSPSNSDHCLDGPKYWRCAYFLYCKHLESGHFRDHDSSRFLQLI